MGILNLTRSGDAGDDDATVDEAPADATDDASEPSGGRRRWLLLGVVAAVLVAAVVLRRRVAREAEFTEIELDPVDETDAVESESESTSAE